MPPDCICSMIASERLRIYPICSRIVERKVSVVTALCVTLPSESVRRIYTISPLMVSSIVPPCSMTGKRLPIGMTLGKEILAFAETSPLSASTAMESPCTVTSTS